MTTPPNYLFNFESTTRLLMILTALVLVWSGAVRMQGRPSVRYAIAGTVSVAFIAWAVLAQRAGAANIYSWSNAPAGVLQQLRLPMALLLPVTAAAVALNTSGQFRRLVSAMPLSWLVAAQVYRVEGAIFLLLWIQGRLPGPFALPAGLGDLVTGCLAIVVAGSLARGAKHARRAAYIWSLFGLTDLVLAVAMGVMTSPGPAHLLALSNPNLLISAYPLVMIPTLGVPLAFILHGAVLWRLARGEDSDFETTRSYALQEG